MGFWLAEMFDGISAACASAWRWISLVLRWVHRKGLFVLAAAIASAIATWYSYLAAERTVEVATASQTFAEQLYADQLALARPSITVLGGTIYPAYSQTSRYSDRREITYRIELRVRNSGGRNARPVWLALSEELGIEDHEVVLDELPKDVDVVVWFDTTRPPNVDKDWLVGIAFGDDIPPRSGRLEPRAAPSGDGLQRVCSRPFVAKMNASWEAGQNGAAPHRIVLSAPTQRIAGSWQNNLLGAKPSNRQSFTSPHEELYRSIQNSQRSSEFCDDPV
ncbi:hypothetical protein [Achromobacter insolitus]|uniref:hypothetical protein n=1 Tax=Achromobacter insolitus TaxID=217204 RepID=UPI002FDFD880